MFAFREKTVWIIAALGLLLLAPSVAGAATQRPCNGSVELCERTLDQVVLAGTHNSMSSAEMSWQLPNQNHSISSQLRLGVRSLLIDTYYGQDDDGDGIVEGISKSVGRQTGATTYMCHAICQLGSVDLTAEFSRIKDFLIAKPREVLVIVNEDYIAPNDFARAVETSGLLPYVYQGSVTQFPTLGQMIDSGQRVVMLGQGEVGDVPWYHRGYDGPMMETPYTFTEPSELTDPGNLDNSCRPNRGTEGSPLFLMNHWVLKDDVTPVPANAEIYNTKEAVVARARACETRRGKLPNIIAVDFYGIGDVLGAVRELNGVSPKPYLETAKPKAAVVRAGRKANFTIPFSNFGDADATGVKVCATVPAKLAKKPRCVTVAVPVDGKATARVTLVTKKKAKGRGVVRFTASSTAGTFKSSTNLRVKPRPKPKRRR